MRPSVLLLPLALLAFAVPAQAAFSPERGGWSGTAEAGDRQDPVTARVVKRDGRYFLKALRTTAHDTCADPAGGAPATVDFSVAAPRMRIRRDRTFGAMDGDLEVKGRFTSRRRAEGTMWVAPQGLTCAGSTIQFVIRAVPVVCGEGCATPRRS